MSNFEYEIKPIFNFHFSTLMLFRCTKRKYAESLRKGNVYFGTPRTWIQMEKDGNIGQGDILEGTFFSSLMDDKSSVVQKLKESSEYEYVCKNGYIFFRRKKILDLHCLCLYGLHDNSFRKIIDDKGKAHYQSNITKQYFSDFSDYRTRDEYDKAEKDEQPVVVFVYNPHEFFRRIRSTLMALGVKEEEIIISPVEYLDRYKPSFTNAQYPNELLLKDKSFINQSEIRIVINSNSTEYIDYMRKNNNTIQVGPLDDITNIYDYYFNDLSVERYGNTGLMFSLPQAVTHSIYSMTFFELEDLLINILRGTVKITNAGEGATTWNEKLKFITDIFNNKFGVIVNVDEHKNVMMYNMSQELIEQSNTRNKHGLEMEKLKKNIEELINEDKKDEALSICSTYYEDAKMSGVAYYYSGKIFLLRGEKNKAIESFYKAYQHDYKVIESLDGIASIYFQQENYQKAIEIYNVIQDEKGYDSDIWCNIGVCYIHISQYEKAIEFFDKGIEKKPTDAYAYYNKGVALYKKGDYVYAKECMEKAIELDPHNTYYKEEYDKAFV